MLRTQWTPSRAFLLALACVAAGVPAGCMGGGSSGGKSFTRRGIEREYVSSPDFGAPRGREFADIIPVGARITAVHVAHAERINAIWLSFERNGQVRQTPRRGGAGGKVQTLKLSGREKLLGIHGYGHGTVDELVIATNRRIVAFGDGTAPGMDGKPPTFATLTARQKQQYVGIGFTGRADEELRQLSLRIQVRRQ